MAIPARTEGLGLLTDSSQRVGERGNAAPAITVRAAEYVRMSTEHQRYSTENQGSAIRQYAARRGIEIVRTYADEGKSGLRLDGRNALKQLIDDVQGGKADFEAILVYDISLWGRFQDADESAYYEYICKRAGVSVQYCAEQFENDGSPVSTIVKGVKRAMAGEYSRELSTKVFAGQCRLIELGYRQGGVPGYGLRRQLIDQSGSAKGELDRGQHKSIQTDRVILVPGPSEEVDTVRWMYRAFVEEGKSEGEIANQLNAREIASDLGRPWTRGTVHQLLIHEKYVGNNVWNRVSFKLKKKRVCNGPEMWIRADGAFEPIVDRTMFQAAQALIRERTHRLSDDEMLDGLRQLLQQRGYLSGLIIDEAEHLPSSSAYQGRFGNLLRAYQLVGFTPERDYRYVEINRTLRAMHPDVIAGTIAGIEQAGGRVVQDRATDLLTINEEFSASIVIVRCRETIARSLRWRVRFDASLCPDITVAVRMDRSNREVLDYYLLPRLDMVESRLRLAEYNGVSLDAYRFTTLDPLFGMASRVRLSEVA
jgi:DNA invertase Pin-like site-specific DNA recombinase